MFTFQPNQVDRFRLELRKKRISELVSSLQAKGLDARFEQPENAIVAASKAGEPPTRIVFDAKLLPAQLVRPTGLSYRFGHDAQGRVARIVYPSGRVMDCERRPDGELAALSQPGFAEYRFEHDALGNVARVVYPGNREYRFSYGPANRLASLTDRAGATWRWNRSATTGELASVEDPLGREVRFETDADGVQKIVFPGGTSVDFEHEYVSGTQWIRFPDGKVHRYFYRDDVLARIEWSPYSAVDIEQDGEGNIAKATAGDSFVEFKRADAGRVTEEITERGAVKYEYDDEGRLTALINPFGSKCSYAYDADGRLQSIGIWNGQTITFEHNGEDEISRISYPNGVVEARALSPSCRTGRAAIQSPRGAHYLTEYTYDASSRLTDVLERSRAGGIEYGRSFEYDSEDHLLAEVDTASGRRLSENQYDLEGNLINVNGRAVAIGSNDEPLDFAGVDVAYDARGQMRSVTRNSAVMQFGFGDEGLLHSVDSPRGTCSYSYDPLGRRVAKDGDAQHVRFGWAQHQLLWEERSEGLDPKAKRREWVFIPNSFTPIAFHEDGKTYFLQHDIRGAIVRVFDSEGELVWSAQYDAFGKARLVVEKITQPWRLAGQYFDEESGLHYSLARYYSPALRSYLSRDPRWMEWEATNYSYARNDPWNRADPTGGLAPLLAAGLVGAMIGGGIALATGQNVLAGAAAGAVAGVAGVVAVGAGLGALAVGATAGALAAVTDSLVTQMQSPDPICVPCLAKAAIIGAALGGALGVFARAAAPTVGKITRNIAHRFGGGPKTAQYVFDARAGRYRDTKTGRFAAERNLPWPDNAGFQSSTKEVIKPGKVLDRYGKPSGRFLGEPGTPVSQRGMAAGTDAMPYTQYRVLKPIEMRVGPAAPVPQFGATGGGQQYLPGRSVQDLVKDGYLEVIK